MSLIKKNKKGFTLIELVIVLAIGALILAGVLIAVQGAQRSRRDTQRKNDMGTIASYLEQWASNHAGAYPTSANLGTFASNYINSNTLQDPGNGANYGMSWAAPTTGGTITNAATTINYQTGYTCTNGSAVASGGRHFAMTLVLESNDTACVGN